MTNLKKTFVGQKVKSLLGNTHNALCLATLQARAGDIAPEAQPSFARKSPVDVLLYWTGAATLPPGSCVKLVEVMIPPSVDPSQPYSDLKFTCREFGPGDTLEDYAITHGPIAPGGVGTGFLPQAAWCLVEILNESHTRALPPASGTTFTSGNDGQLIYWKPAGVEGMYWCVVKMHAEVDPTSAEPPLRRFELTANKTRAGGTATAKFLDDAGNLVGAATTLYDPENYYYGKTAGFTTGGNAFRGVALLRRDLAEVEADRWEIIDCERFYQIVVLTYSSGESAGWKFTEGVEIDQNWHPPADVGGAITLEDPLSLVASPANGDKVVAVLSDPDTTPPTYTLIDAEQAAADIILVKITSVITARSGTTKGTGTAQPMDPDDLTAAVGDPITVKNLSRSSYTGTSGVPLFTYAIKIGTDYHLGTFDTTSILLWNDEANQSLGHDENLLPEWQDDTLECPPPEEE